jgi:hypothetical protein
MPIPEDQDIEALEEEFLLNYLPSNFPKEFSELCLLPPLHGNEDLIRTAQLSLGEIIYRHRRMFTEDKDYFVRIEKCIQLATSSANDLREFADLFMKMDTVHRDATLNAANEIAPHQFPDQKLGEFFRQLTAISKMMDILAAAVTFGTGISAAKRGKGRPGSSYIIPAWELMQEWEFITAKPMTVGEAVKFFEPADELTAAERGALRRDATQSHGFRIKPVPTPRPLGKGKDKDQKRQYVEDSSASIGLCLKMIKPDITDSQVITSIKRAVKLRAVREQMVENIGLGKSPLLALTEAILDRK